jgi:hypothetical protein
MKRLPLLLLCAAACYGAEYPTAEIANESITAKIYTPDAKNGYYRGTRFDWSGVIYSLTYAGHEYFGEWQQSDDPYLHDHITGPVEEFRSEAAGLGYQEASAGGTFLRIGIGVCEKPADDDYDWRHSYKVVDPGEWQISKGRNWIELAHTVSDPGSGYGYRYVKRLTLTPGSPQLVIDHWLVNTGRHAIETSVYNHNFFVIDGRPTGPEFSVRFPFELSADRDLKGYASVRGRELVYDKEIPAGENIIALLSGWGATPSDNSFVIESAAVKAGVRMSADKPLSKLQFWSPRTTLCPEPYIDLAIAPGQADRWSIRYDFLTLD